MGMQVVFGADLACLSLDSRSIAVRTAVRTQAPLLNSLFQHAAILSSPHAQWANILLDDTATNSRSHDSSILRSCARSSTDVHIAIRSSTWTTGWGGSAAPEILIDLIQ